MLQTGYYGFQTVRNGVVDDILRKVAYGGELDDSRLGAVTIPHYGSGIGIRFYRYHRRSVATGKDLYQLDIRNMEVIITALGRSHEREADGLTGKAREVEIDMRTRRRDVGNAIVYGSCIRVGPYITILEIPSLTAIQRYQ